MGQQNERIQRQRKETSIMARDCRNAAVHPTYVRILHNDLLVLVDPRDTYPKNERLGKIFLIKMTLFMHISDKEEVSKFVSVLNPYP